MAAYLGYRTTGAVSHSFLADGRTGQQEYNMVATPGHTMYENGHAYKMGIRAGSESGVNCSTILIIYELLTAGSINNATPVAQTAAISITSDWDLNKPTYEANLTAAFAMQNGDFLWPTFLETTGLLEVGKTGVGSAGNPYNSTTSDTPPNPFSSDGYLYLAGYPYIWIEYEPNVAPDVPSDFSPADGATITDTTPTYEADFTDANQVLPNGLTSDYLNVYQIQVRSVTAENATTGTVVWDSGAVAASSTEKANARFSRDHAGSALSLNTRYQWRSRVQDRFGVWSAWSHADAAAWSDFFVSQGGIVTLEDDPTGRITDTTPDFEGKYHHVLGTAADRVQIRLYAGSTLLSTSAEITKAVSSSAAPGTLFTITAAESGFGTLANGVEYGYSIRARTSGSGTWSDWSAIRTFTTNGRPATPSNLRPVSGSVTTSYPLLTVQTSDPDGDSLTVTAHLTEDDGTPIDDLAMTYDATLYSGQGGYKVQLTGTEITTYDTYKWTADASDGDLTSATSAEATFVYAEGPAITVTAPTEGQTITTDTPTITWTVTDQQKKRIRVYRTSDDALIHDSTQLTNTTQSYTLPADLLANETDYYLTVEIENSLALTGTSAARNFTLEYTPPATVTGFAAIPEAGLFDSEPSMIRLTWVPVETDPGMFEGYVITRRNLGQDVTAATVIMTLASRDQASWIDTIPLSGVEQVYTIVQKVRESSIDLLTSDAAEASATVNLLGSVISDVRDGLNLRAVFESVEERQDELRRTTTELDTWEGGPAWVFEGPGHSHVITMTARLYARPNAEVADVLEALIGDPAETHPLTPPYGGLAGVRSDGSLVLCCYRDERGRKLFGRVLEPVVSDQRLLRADVEFRLQEVRYSEGVS